MLYQLTTHPRLTRTQIGVVDHISIAPLVEEGGAHLEEAKATALRVGQGLAGGGWGGEGGRGPGQAGADEGGADWGGVGAGVGLPILFYGAAHPEGRTLAETRRLTSYFTKDGCSGDATADPSAIDLGPLDVDPTRGVCCCGAVALVLNYNIRLATRDKVSG